MVSWNNYDTENNETNIQKKTPVVSEIVLVSLVNNVIIFILCIFIIIALTVTVTTSARFIEAFNNLLLNMNLTS